jgi:hypothetical protein
MLNLVISDGPDDRPFSTHKGWGICRMADMDLGEYSFHALR